MVFILRYGEEDGPYTEEQLRAKLLNAEVKLSDLAWRQEFSEWTTLSEVLGIRPPPPPTLPSSSVMALGGEGNQPDAAEIRLQERKAQDKINAQTKQSPKLDRKGCGCVILIILALVFGYLIDSKPLTKEQQQQLDNQRAMQELQRLQDEVNRQHQLNGD